MNKKYIIVIIGVVLFLILTNFIKGDSLVSKKVKETEEKTQELEKEESQELNLIDYYNLEGENRALQAQIDHKNQTIFELYKVIVSSGTLEELPNYEFMKVTYKEVNDSEIIVLSQEEGSDSSYISILTKDQSYGNYMSNLKEEQKINWSALHGLYSGVVQDNGIKKVNVYKNEQVFEARILEIDEGLRVWFAILNYEAKSKNDELDQMRIQALDSNGNVLWEESFENDFDRVI